MKLTYIGAMPSTIVPGCTEFVKDVKTECPDDIGEAILKDHPLTFKKGNKPVGGGE